MCLIPLPVVLYGVREEEDECWDTTNIIVRYVIKKTGHSLDDRDIERAHRVRGSSYQRPIVCKLAHYFITRYLTQNKLLLNTKRL